MIRGDYEYGNVALLEQLSCESGLLDLLEETFPYDKEQIVSFIFLRLLRPLPLKSMRYQFEKTYLSEKFARVSMSQKSLSNLLQRVGDNLEMRTKLMRKLTREGKYGVIDLTALLSYSENLVLLERGHNHEHLSIPQVNLLMLFSSDRKLPTFIRLLPGSVRDVSTIKNTVSLAEIENYILIGDRGFFSEGNVEDLREEKISFIFPLKRNSTYIPKRLTKKFEGVFLYNGRPIVFWKGKRKGRHLYIYEDQQLKKEEETTSLMKIEAGATDQEQYLASREKFGKIFLLSNLDMDPRVIYGMYKDRAQIEYCFNAYKNLLEADKSYLREDNKLEGYTFINFLSLHLYYLMLNKLKNSGLNKQYSVSDILLQLSKIKVYKFEKSEVLSEIPKKVRKIIEAFELDIDLLRTKGRS
jgi:transposase